MKLERLMAITMILLNRKRVQAHELAEQLQVSLRTVYRDLESLNLAGIPIVSYTGAEGGFEIMDSFRLDRQLLSYDELMSLTIALQGLQSTGTMNENKMERLMDKVGALVARAEQGRMDDRERIQIDFSPWRHSKADRAKFELLRQAALERRVVVFTYVDGKGEVTTARSVEPMEIALKGYVWYLYGYCLRRNDYRTFRLSRIRELQTTPKLFERKQLTRSDSPKEVCQTPVYGTTLELVLRFEGGGKAAASDHFEEHELEWQSDGSLIVRATLPDKPWIIGYLLHFRTDVIVLEPHRIAEKLRDAALSIASLYENSPETDNG
ncbi:helix-turn-helix transcriptional regulator [Paenibacillus lentus]|uniref:YafY family transcriptional regulator n=1 Tax=Paenibacillus lentus TaxID=1338368 RepID=A0A3Q8SDT3_9BACL|nr:YafY family protein [Paenibacillus lentus]AZK48246.1 YafY family transcriptional regulator [Paenibacillus lentus]